MSQLLGCRWSTQPGGSQANGGRSDRNFFLDAKMRLREWVTNDRRLQEHLGVLGQAMSADGAMKVLGIRNGIHLLTRYSLIPQLLSKQQAKSLM